MWINTLNDRSTVIPSWRARDLRPGTIAGILRDLGISRSDLNRA